MFDVPLCFVYGLAINLLKVTRNAQQLEMKLCQRGLDSRVRQIQYALATERSFTRAVAWIQMCYYKGEPKRRLITQLRKDVLNLQKRGKVKKTERVASTCPSGGGMALRGT